MIPFLLLVISCFSRILCIQNGQDAITQSRYPFYIMIGNPHICGGTLISYDPALVLTAAHCVDAPVHPKNYSKEKNPYFAQYNDIHRDKQRAVAIIDWNIHPLYNMSGNINIKYDAAIVQLANPLKKSVKIKRAALWSPTLSPRPGKGELIGFGYEDIDAHLPKKLQVLDLKITQLDSNGAEYIESKTNMENQIACHGDSGGPLVIHESLIDPSTNKSESVPFVLGDLTRIFGARDVDSNQLSCPVPINSTNTAVTQVFTNSVSLLDWISTVSGISKENLTDPFYSPPCKGCSKSGEEIKHSRKWSIGVVVDENGLVDTENENNISIGSMTQDFYVKASAEDSSSPLRKPSIILLSSVYFIIYIYTIYT